MSRVPTHGAWCRHSASIEGGPHFETQHVIWLQAGTCYADIRVPFHQMGDERCFTGRSDWVDDRYRWTHHLDLETVAGVVSPAADDIGDLSWEGGVLVERGLFPTATGAVAYVELWSPLPDADGPYVALEGPRSCLVRVGGHAITVEDNRASGGLFSACYRRLTADGWSVVVAIGDGSSLPDPTESRETWTVVHQGDEAAVRA